jgi:predicted O-methyltransferase YrrM
MQVRTVSSWSARHPHAVKHVPRLLRTVGKTTLSERLPWLPFDVIDLLDAKLVPAATVFEYGGGGSTAWFADRVDKVVTAEHDADWLAMLCTAVPNDKVTVLHRSADNDFADYVAAIKNYPDASFDVVVVDGRRRVRCFEQAIPKVKPGGLLILDDVDREYYSPAFDMVKWPRTVFHGFAPCKDTIAHTAVFTAPAGL